MAGFSESSTVQAWLIERLGELGWQYTPGDELPRESTDSVVEEWLIEAIEALNPAVSGAPERVDEVLPLLRMAVLGAASEGLVPANEGLTTLLRGDHTVKYVGTTEYVPLRLIDFKDLTQNHFVVSDEVTFGPPGKERRYDVVLWVNGFPLVVIETKSPVRASVSWLNGARDLANVYEVEGPTFFASNVLVAATEGREFHYGAVGQPGEQWLMWGSTQDPYDLWGLKRVERSVDLLLNPARVLSILRDFTLFERVPGGGVRKLIPRYPQVEAAEAIHQRVLDGGLKGLIWHYQGTGKTLLMAFAALMLLHDERVGGPTIVVVLDRLDLIEQVERQFKSAGLPRITVAGSREELRQVLRDDRRGIVLTTIFRFEDAGLLNERDNIIVMVDEAHRTQEGRLGDDLRAALPNARFFGLTGTPISDKDRNTFKLFGDPSDPGYILNTYSMERSIADGASVPVHVETRLVNFHLDKAAMDEAFDEMAEEEGLTDEEREVLADKAASVKTLLLNPARIEAVCIDIIDHYQAKIAPVGMKAQVVTFDRELVVAYDQILNRLIVERGLTHQTAVVMTVGTSKAEPADWSKYALDRAAEARVKQRFNDPEDPLAFLIVTAKLLTGFDAPIEQVMYLDRPLRRHTLFQAITRTNRRYTNPRTGQEKRHGLVVDYIGLGNQIAQALKAADPDRGGKRPVEVDDLVAEFEATLARTLSPRFDGIDRTDHSFAALQAAMERLSTDPVGVPRPARGPRRARGRLQVARAGLRGRQAHPGVRCAALAPTRGEDPRTGPRAHPEPGGHRHGTRRGGGRPGGDRGHASPGPARRTRPRPQPRSFHLARHPRRGPQHHRRQDPATPRDQPSPDLPVARGPDRAAAPTGDPQGRGLDRLPQASPGGRPHRSAGRAPRSRGPHRRGPGTPRSAHWCPDPDSQRLQARQHSGDRGRRRPRHRHHREAGALHRVERDPGGRPHRAHRTPQGPQEVRPATHRRPVQQVVRLHQ